MQRAVSKNVVRPQPQRVLGPITSKLDSFDPKVETRAIRAAIDGADNPWAPLRKLYGKELGEWDRVLRDRVDALAGERADEVYVLTWNRILEAKLNQSKAVRRFYERIPEDLEARGPIFHGYVGHVAVPQGKQNATFTDLIDFLPVMQGKKPAQNRLARLGQRLAAWAGLPDRGLSFDRYMYPPDRIEDGLDGGYSQIDPTRVDPRYGGDEAYRAFMKEMVERNIGAITDFIANHNSRLHPRTQALLAGDLDLLDQHIHYTGAVKVDVNDWVNGQTMNVLVHTGGEHGGAVSRMWAIFPDSNPHSLVRKMIPVQGKFRDLDVLERTLGAFALDATAQNQVRALYQRHGLPEPDAEGKRFLPKAAQLELQRIQRANRDRVRAELKAQLDRGETPEVAVDFAMSFMGNIQFDKNIAHPKVLHEDLESTGRGAELGQADERLDAIIHAKDSTAAIGTDHLNIPLTHAYGEYKAVVGQLMAPGRQVLPEAFLPPEQIRSDWLDPSFQVAGRTYSSRGSLALEFKAAQVNSEALLTGDATAFLRHIRTEAANPPKNGKKLGYGQRLHDENLLPEPLRDALTAEGRLRDPLDAIDALEKKGPVDIDTALAALREELKKPAFSNFAGRAAGDDPAHLLGLDPKKMALAQALNYAGTEMPAVYYRSLIPNGNNIEFALGQMRGRLRKQQEAGEPINFRKAFDARDLGRGPVALSDWKRHVRARFEPLEVVRVLNRLWKKNAALRSRRPAVVPTGDTAVAVLARTAPRHSGLLQVFNVSNQPRTVRISKAELQKALGWNRVPGKLVDVIATERGRVYRPFDLKTVQRVELRDAGDHVELTVGPNGFFFLQ